MPCAAQDRFTSVTSRPHTPPPLLPARSEEVSKARLNRIRGVEHHDRLDQQLYQDFESEEAKKVSWSGHWGHGTMAHKSEQAKLGTGRVGCELVA